MNKKVFRNVLFSFIDKITVLLFNMVISVIAARYLGAADYGKYTYFIVIYSFVNSFSAFGMEQIVTKELVANENKQRSILYAAVIVSFAASCLTELGVILLQVITGFLTWMEVITLGIICFINISSVFRYYLTAIYHMGNIVKVKNVLLLMVIIIDIIFMAVGAPVEYFILAFALKEGFAMGASFIVFIMSKEKDELLNQDLLPNDIIFMIKKILRLCFPLLLSGLSVIIYLKIDQVMIKDMLGEKQLGIYSAGIKLVEVLFNIPIAVVTGSLPYFAEKYVKEPEEFWKQYERLTSGLFFVTYFIVIIVLIFGKWIIYILYGAEYIESASILVIYAWSMIPVSMGCIRSVYLSIREYSFLSFIYSIVSSGINILINILWIPVLGIKGAAAASVISYFLQAFLFTLFSSKTRRIAKIQFRSLYGYVFIKNISKEDELK